MKTQHFFKHVFPVSLRSGSRVGLFRLLLVVLFAIVGTTTASAQNEAYAVIDYADGVDVMTFYYDNNRSSHTGGTEVAFLLNPNDSKPIWWDDAQTYIYAMHVGTVVFDATFAAARPTTTAGWFRNMERLTSVTGLENLNTSQVTDMNNMFYNCWQLPSLNLNLSSWDTSKVTNMRQMFYNCRALVSLNLSNWNVSNVTNMGSMFENCDDLIALNLSGWNTAKLTNHTKMFVGCHSLGSLNVSGWTNTLITDMSDFFANLNSLININLTNFKTPAVTNMAGMFRGCKALTSLDLSSFNTAKVTDMNNMFYNCNALTGITYGSNWNTSKVTDISYMFEACSSLTSLNLSSFNTGNVTSINGIFEGCTSLESITFGSGWTNSKLTTTYCMFKDCSALTSLDLSSFNVGNVENVSQMFEGCSNLVTLNLSGWNISKLTHYSGMFKNCTKLASLNVSGWTNTLLTSLSSLFANLPALTTINMNSFNIGCATDLSSMFSGCSSLRAVNLSSFNTANVTTVSGMFAGCTALNSVTFGSGWTNTKLTSLSSLFAGCSSLASIVWSSFNTSHITNMNSMFCNCSSLTSLNLNTLNTKNVTNMGGMFNGCTNLTSITYGSNWDTSKVTNMSGMFGNCSAFTTIDLRKYNTANVTDMGGMFAGCTNLRGITYGSDWNTSQVENMSSLFEGCSSFTSINLSNYNTSNVTLMSSMFKGCSMLESITYGSGWNTSNVTKMDWMFWNCVALATLNLSRYNTASVTDMNSMFRGCTHLANIPGISTLNTSNLKNVSSMFQECTSLTTLALSGWNATKLEDTSYMFQGCTALSILDICSWSTPMLFQLNYMFANCSNLSTVYVGSGWVTPDKWPYWAERMFEGCTSKLTGGQGTTWNSDNPTDNTYARIDGGTSKPGYFTGKEVTYGLRVGGVEVTNGNASRITGTGISGSVSFDISSHTLTLTNATITNASSYGGIYTGYDYAFSDLTINLVGDNTLNVTGGYTSIQLRQNTTFTGTGSLSGWGVCRVFGGKKLTVDGGCHISGNNIYGDSKQETLVVKNSATKVDLTGTISSFTSVTLQNGLIYSKPVGGSYDTTNKYVVDVNGNRATGVSISNTCNYGLLIGNIAVTNQNASNITGTGITGSVKFDASTHTLTLTNATITTSSMNGISTSSSYPFDDLTIKLVGNNTINSGNYGSIVSTHNTTITGTGTLTGGNLHIYYGKSLTISGGCTTTLKSLFGASKAETLVVKGASTKVQLSSNISGFASVTLQDGLSYTSPVGGSYDTTNKYVVDANGNKATGVSIGYLTEYGLTIAGTAVTNLNASNITGSGITGSVKFEASTHTLTLTNATITSSTAAGIVQENGYSFDDLIIKLVGTNAINLSGSWIPVVVQRNTTITGTGTLTTGLIKVYNGKELTIGGGCTVNVSNVTGTEKTETLVLRNAQTKLTSSTNIRDFASVTLYDGLNISTPAGGYYDTTKKAVVNSAGNIVTGVTISNNTDYEYGVNVAGVPVKVSNASNITGTGISGSVSFNPDTRVLTLTNATITSSTSPGIQVATNYAFDNLTINLVGNNVLNITGYIAMPLRCNTTITGTGSLSLGGGNIDMRDNKNLVIEGGCSLTAYSIGGGSSTSSAALTVRGNDTQVNLTFGFLYFGSVTLEDGLYYAKPQGGYYDTNTKYMADSSGNKWTDGVIVKKAPPYVAYNSSNTTLTFYHDGQISAHVGAGEMVYYLNEGDDDPEWYDEGIFEDVTKVVFDPSFAAARPTSTFNWFAEMYNLTNITGIENLNTEDVTTMSGMFWECTNLPAVDVSGFNTQNVTDMQSMFAECYELTSLDVSGWNTSNVTNMNYLFGSCGELTSLDVSHFNTAKVTDMSNMFDGCSGLTSLDLSSFNTAKVTDMSYMFNYCSGLTNLDLSSFNTANVTKMYCMFMYCSGLTSIDLSSFNTAKVTDMNSMFYDCSALTSLDLSSFNTAKVTDMRDMFRLSESLITINVGDGWSTAAASQSNNMFLYCSSLVGGMGTTYDASQVDKAYAHIDAGTGNPGYLSEKAYSYAVLNEGVLTFYFDGQRSWRPGTSYVLKTGNTTPGWYDNRTEVSRVVFDPSFADARPTSTYSWFNGMSNLVSIEGIEHLNTSSVTTMKAMFSGCRILEDLDVSGFNTANVTNMSSMFSSCRALTQLNLANFDTGNVTDMAYMFSQCYSLTTLDLTSFNTANVTTMREMFYLCTNLTSLDVSSFNTANVTSFYDMFNRCRSLTYLDLSNFDTKKVTTMYYMFNECTSLKILDLSSFETPSVKNFQYTFFGCSNLESIYAGNWSGASKEYDTYMFAGCTKIKGSEGTTYVDQFKAFTYAHIDGGTSNPGYFSEKPFAYAVYNGGTLTFYYDGKRSTRTGTTYDLNDGANNPGWVTDKNNRNVTAVVFDAKFVNARPTSTYRWFYGMYSLASITGLENLNTSEVTNMNGMFAGCELTLDLSHFDTQKVTDMGSMFEACAMESLDLSSFDTRNVTTMVYMFGDCSIKDLNLISFNTENVTNMSSMFYECSSLTTLDLSSFNTSNVTNMNSMFFDCACLTSLDLSSFDTRNVTNMESMFCECSDLMNLNVSSFNTSNVTSMGNMFGGCGSLTSLDVSSFNTEATTNMSYMFAGCTNLTTLDVSSLNTASATNMSTMFSACSSLTSLDLSGFNTAAATNMSYMFSGCTNLKTIYVGDSWTTANVTTSSYMFRNCSTNLKGGQGTTWSDTNPVDKTYAHIDGGTSNPGYFSEKPAFILGDVNGDGQITIADVTALVNIILGKDTAGQYNHSAADVNGDGQITIADVTALVNIILGK